MKKIIFSVATALGLTMASNAAVYAWGLDASADLAPYAGNTVYVLASTFVWSDTATKLTDVQGAKVSEGTIVSAGRGKYWVDAVSFSDTKDIPSTYNALFVIVDGDGKYVKWNDTLTGYDSTDSDPPVLSYTAANLASFTSAQGGAKAFGGGSGPVPEPTSGLLMLLGVAGLALKRKRA